MVADPNLVHLLRRFAFKFLFAFKCHGKGQVRLKGTGVVGTDYYFGWMCRNRLQSSRSAPQVNYKQIVARFTMQMDCRGHMHHQKRHLSLSRRDSYHITACIPRTQSTIDRSILIMM